MTRVTLPIPETAVEVFFHWEITPDTGRVHLLRTPTDPTPQILIGPSGNGHAELVEPGSLYYELMLSCKTFRLYTDGWRDLRR